MQENCTRDFAAEPSKSSNNQGLFAYDNLKCDNVTQPNRHWIEQQCEDPNQINQQLFTQVKFDDKFVYVYCVKLDISVGKGLSRPCKDGVEKFHRLVDVFVDGVQVNTAPKYMNGTLDPVLPDGLSTDGSFTDDIKSISDALRDAEEKLNTKYSVWGNWLNNKVIDFVLSNILGSFIGAFVSIILFIVMLFFIYHKFVQYCSCANSNHKQLSDEKLFEMKCFLDANKAKLSKI